MILPAASGCLSVSEMVPRESQRTTQRCPFLASGDNLEAVCVCGGGGGGGADSKHNYNYYSNMIYHIAENIY